MKLAKLFKSLLWVYAFPFCTYRQYLPSLCTYLHVPTVTSEDQMSSLLWFDDVYSGIKSSFLPVTRCWIHSFISTMTSE